MAFLSHATTQLTMQFPTQKLALAVRNSCNQVLQKDAFILVRSSIHPNVQAFGNVL